MNKGIKPYTYLIRFKPTRQLYCGCRYANYVNAQDDLLKLYWTSSSIVNKLIYEHGLESFEIINIIEHETYQEALIHEEKVLQHIDAKNNDKWLNRSNGGSDCIGMNMYNTITKNQITIK